MNKHKTLVLSGYGLNCEKETAYCCQKSGQGTVDVVHLHRLTSGEVGLNDYHFIVFIGGFLDGDDLGAGRVGANRIKHAHSGTPQPNLQEQLVEFVEGGRLVLGICNGFQMLVKLGLLPATRQTLGHQEVSLTANQMGKFEDRWVSLIVDEQSPCVFTQGLTQLELPVRHGEGRIEADREQVLQPLISRHQAPLRYADENQQATEAYPANPNGSPYGLAALCNAKGTVLGLMPHPEAYHHFTNHPQWTRRKNQSEEGEGLKLFHNAYRYLAEF